MVEEEHLALMEAGKLAAAARLAVAAAEMAPLLAREIRLLVEQEFPGLPTERVLRVGVGIAHLWGQSFIKLFEAVIESPVAGGRPEGGQHGLNPDRN